MGKTAVVTIVLVHGAGSTGAAAATLVGPRLLGEETDAVLLEDRTGDIDQVIAAIDDTVARHPRSTSIVGISLGAHALARWASTTRRPVPPLVCVLPAWIGEASESAQATAAAARAIAAHGIPATLDRLAREGRHSDVVDLLRVSWPDYSDDELAGCLQRAAEGRGPSASELAAITAPVAVVGWMQDAFHPDAVARAWARYLPRAVIALAARPDIRLLQRALATATGGSPSRRARPH